MGEIVSQCITIWNYHNVHFKYITILIVNFASLKVENKDSEWGL